MSEEKKGLGGLLIFADILVVANVFMSAVLGVLGSFGIGIATMEGNNPIVVSLLAWLLLPAGLGLLVYSIIVAVSFFKKKRSAPGELTKFFIAALCFLGIEAIVLTVARGPMMATATWAEMLMYIIPGILTLIVWILYSKNSKRVANTFVN